MISILSTTYPLIIPTSSFARRESLLPFKKHQSALPFSFREQNSFLAELLEQLHGCFCFKTLKICIYVCVCM